MKNRLSSKYLLVAFLAFRAFAAATPGFAQGNLDVQRDSELSASRVEPAAAAALEAELLLGGTSPRS